VLGNWLPKKTRGLIVGFWIGCVNVGDIAGQEFALLLHDVAHLDIEWVFLFHSSCLLVLLILVVALLRPYPEKYGLADLCDNKIDYEVVPVDPEVEARLGEKENCAERYVNKPLHPYVKKHGINFFSAWVLPNVAIYTMTFVMLKSA